MFLPRLLVLGAMTAYAGLRLRKHLGQGDRLRFSRMQKPKRLRTFWRKTRSVTGSYPANRP